MILLISSIPSNIKVKKYIIQKYIFQINLQIQLFKNSTLNQQNRNQIIKYFYNFAHNLIL